MILKNWFFKGIGEELKRRLWAAALSVLVFFFSLPVVMVYLTTSEYTGGDWTANFTRDALKVLSYDNGWMIFLMAVLAVLLGVSGFSYLNSRRKVDFYHSLPMRREKLFAVQYVSGILIAAVPYLFFAVVSAAVAAASGAPGGAVMKTALEGWAYQMLSFTILYTTAVIAVMMTGNTVVALLGFAVFNAYIPAMLGLLESLAETCLDTFCDYEMMAGWVPKTSPFAFYISGLTDDISAGRIFSRLAVWAVLVLIALFLHKKRPSEAAGKAMAFPVSQPIIRILLVVEFALAGLLFFWILGKGGMGWAVFGLLAGGVISHCVIEIIYHFDFEKLFSHRLQMGASLVLAFALFALFRWDLMGYDRWIPDPDRLHSAAVYSDEVDGWVDYGSFTNRYGQDSSWTWTGNQEYIFENMSLEDKNLARNLAETWNRLSSEDGENWWETVYVEYRMESGRRTTRRYNFPEGTLRQAMAPVYEDQGYKNGRYPLLEMDGDQLQDVQLSIRGETVRLGRQEAVSRENLRALLEAYQQDLREMTLEDFGQAPAAEIRFLDERRVKAVENQDYRYDGVEYYPIYPSFFRTLEVLGSIGVEVDQKVDPESIRSIQVEAEIQREAEGDAAEQESWTYAYQQYEETDRDTIGRIAEEMIYGPYQRYQNLYENEGDVYLDVDFYAESAAEADSLGDGNYARTDQGEIYYTVRYYLPAGDLADELTEKAVRLWEVQPGQ